MTDESTISRVVNGTINGQKLGFEIRPQGEKLAKHLTPEQIANLHHNNVDNGIISE